MADAASPAAANAFELLQTYFAGRGAQGGAVAQHLPELFERASIDPKRRGETLSLAEFVQLGQELLAVQAQLGQ